MIRHRATYQRIIRRETHSPRSVLAITLAALLILALVYLAGECVLAFLGQPALLLAPRDVLGAAVDLPATVAASAVLATALVVAGLGFVLVLAALSPGRLPGHVGQTTRTAVVVDNRAIASALARRAAYAANLDPDRVLVSVSRRVADVRVQPASGWPVNAAAITDAVTDEITRLNLTPTLRPRVLISRQAVVGA